MGFIHLTSWLSSFVFYDSVEFYLGVWSDCHNCMARIRSRPRRTTGQLASVPWMRLVSPRWSDEDLGTISWMEAEFSRSLPTTDRLLNHSLCSLDDHILSRHFRQQPANGQGGMFVSFENLFIVHRSQCFYLCPLRHILCHNRWQMEICYCGYLQPQVCYQRWLVQETQGWQLYRILGHFNRLLLLWCLSTGCLSGCLQPGVAREEIRIRN